MVHIMRPCSICIHPERASIEDALLRKTAMMTIAERFGVGSHAVWRHSKHLARSVVCTGPTPLVERVELLMTRLQEICSKAEKRREWRNAVAALKEVRECLELFARVTGQMPSLTAGSTVAVAVNVTTGHSVNTPSDHDLDISIAQSVAEAAKGTSDKEREALETIRGALGDGSAEAEA